MKNRMVKLIGALMAAAVIVNPLTALAAENGEADSAQTPLSASRFGGDYGVVSIELPAEEKAEVAESSIGMDAAVQNVASYFFRANYSYDWTRYESLYYYKYYLNSKEKQLYDAWENQCLAIINSEDPHYSETYTTIGSSEGPIAYLPMVDFGRDTVENRESAEKVATIFRYSNPQFFFLSNVTANQISHDYNNNWNLRVGLTLYGDYASPAARKTAISRYKSQINSWINTINNAAAGKSGLEAVFEKEKKAHDIICEKVSYASADEMNDYKMQSSRSVVLGNKTVCAGYTMTMNLLMNGTGVPAIANTSDNHAWNKVKIGTYWYIVDVTWDDLGTGVRYEWFNRSDDWADANDDTGRPHQEYTNIYGNNNPPAPIDAGGDVFNSDKFLGQPDTTTNSRGGSTSGGSTSGGSTAGGSTAGGSTSGGSSSGGSTSNGNTSGNAKITNYRNEYVGGVWYNALGRADTRYSGGHWKVNATGWWYTDRSGWYPVNQWLKIDGLWYYFDGRGYMESNCYRDGCWLNGSGAWDTRYSGGRWASNYRGWWYTDASGWYPVNSWLKIDGNWYFFYGNGYMAANAWIGGWYVSGSGAMI